jgi:L-fuculose-phosphate aldolase
VYRKQPEAMSMLHSHGAFSVAVSFAGQDFQPVDFEGQYYFDSVPVLSMPYEDYLEKAPEAVASALAESPVAMVRGHGVYAWGETLNRAYKWTCSLELSAKTYVIARQAADL